MATFNFVGTLRAIKDTENFKGFSVTNFQSGWMTERLRFNVIAGDNRHLVEINAGRWQQEDKNTIHTLEKVKGNNKGNPIQIPWNKRNDHEIVDKIVGYRKFTVDTDTVKHRKELEKSGDVAALTASNNKRKHFLAGTDFCEYVNKIINSEKTKDWKFRVTGNINYTYNEKTGMYYSTYEVNKIYHVEDDVVPTSEITMDFYFAENAMDSDDYEETGKAIVNGYTQYYDSNVKKNVFCPVCLVMRFGVDEEGIGKLKWYEEDIFGDMEDDEIRKIGLVCQHINGAQRVAVTYDDLSDKVKRAIDRKVITLEKAIRDAGGTVYGDKIQEIRIVEPGRGYSMGSESTHYTLDDMKARSFKENMVSDNTDIFNDVDVDVDDDDDL